MNEKITNSNSRVVGNKNFSNVFTSLLLSYLVCLSITIVLALRFQGSLDSQPDEQKPKEKLFGVFWNSDVGTDMHLVQASVVLVLMGLVYLAARLSGEKYVYRWTLTWASFLLYYAWLSIEGLFFEHWLIQNRVFSTSMESFLFILSTYFILLAGLQLRADVSLRDEALVGIALLLALFFPTSLAFLEGWSFGPVFAVSNAAMACVCTIYAGLSLQRYLGIHNIRHGLPGGAEVVPIFVLYGLLQIGSAWIGQRPTWSAIVYPLALVLKVPCSLSVVAIALRSSFAKSEERKEDLALKSTELEKALRKAETSRNLIEMREEALSEIRSVMSQDRRASNALVHLVEIAAKSLGAAKGALYVPCPSDLGRCLFLYYTNRSIELGQEKVAIDLDSTIDGEGRVVDVLLREIEADEYARFLRLNLKGLENEAVLVLRFTGSQKNDNTEIYDEVAQEVVRRAETAFELSFLRELADIGESLRDLTVEGVDLRTHLDDLARVGAGCVAASLLAMEIKDERSQTRHLGYFSDKSASSGVHLRDELLGDASHSLLPAEEQWIWRKIDNEIENNDSVQHPHYKSSVRILVDNGRGVTGVLTCEDRKHPQDASLIVPFSEFDAIRLRMVGEMAVAAAERELRHQKIEHLVAQNIHELRQSVSSLRNIVRWLGKTLEPAENTKMWKKLLDAKTDVKSLRSIVDTVDVYQNDVQESPTEVQIFGEIIMKAGAGLRERLLRFEVPRKKQKIEYLRVHLIPTLLVPKSSVQSIVLNLAENALKYRDPLRGIFRLEFEGNFDDQHYKIHVRDWGIGIPDGWEQQIFSDGERAPNAMQCSHPGKGMGLATARQYARSLGGDVVLEGKANPTEFVVLLPRSLGV